MGFLKKLFGKKEEKKEEKQQSNGSVILSMPMFKGDKAYSLDEVVQDLKSYWGLDVKDVGGDDDTATFVIDDKLVAVALMTFPIPAEDLECIYGYSYLWNNVEEETKEHTMHAIVSIISGREDSVMSYSILSKVNASILRSSENAIGVYNGTSTLLLPKNLYLDFAKMMKEEMLPIQLWVYIGIIKDGDKSSVYTYGMKEFGKSEMEIINSAKDSEELYYFLLSILQYILKDDVLLKDGETIGFTEDEKIKIRESKAVYLEGNSLKLLKTSNGVL